MFGGINDAKWPFPATFLLVAAGGRVSRLGSAVAGAPYESTRRRRSPPVRLMFNGISGARPEIYFAEGKPYESDAYNLCQGQRLYTWFGCQSCRDDGRGNIGPSFLDG